MSSNAQQKWWKETVSMDSPLHPPALGRRQCSHWCRSERSQSCPPWTDGSWRLRMSNRTSFAPRRQEQNSHATDDTHTHILYVLLQRDAHPVVGQLKSHLDEGIWTDSTLLDRSFAKVSEDKDVEDHIVSQGLGHCQRLRYLLLTLRRTHPNS